MPHQHLLAFYAGLFAFVFLADAQMQEVCYGPGGEQSCEDYTYAGSLVEELPFQAAFQEVLLFKEQLDGFPPPSGECREDLAAWISHVQTYYETGTIKTEQLIPMQNHIMAHHEEVAQDCPRAWLLTLLLKIESNLQNGREGRSCARVHATGCLRDARGYWKIYASMRAQYAIPNLEPSTLLLTGEERVLSSFRQSFGTTST